MVKLKALLSVLFSVIILFTLITPTQTQAKNNDDENELQTNLYFRKAFGLNHDEDYVKSIMKLHKKSQAHGISLSDDEENGLNRRFEKERRIKPLLLDEVRKDPDFAWIYIDQANNGQFNIGFTKDVSQKKNVINRYIEIAGEQSLINVHTAKISEKSLNELAQNIFNKKEELQQQGLAIKKIEVDIPKEKVNVSISPYTEGNIKIVNSIFGGEFLNVSESNEDVKLTATTRSDYISPLQSGTAISVKGTWNYPTNYCSSGFTAKDSNGTYYLVTAGHCENTNDVVYQGGKYIGLTSGTHQGGTNDSSVITIPASLASKKVFVSSAGDVTLTSAQASNSDVVGEHVCKVGATTGNTCGQIKSTTVYDSIAGTVYQWVRSADYASTGGDSGGLVYDGTTAKGIHFACTGGAPGVPITSYYSHISAILTQWGLTF